MFTISLCMIVKDEEQVLARCLESAKPIADEIIVVDTGSTDGTRQIARRYADKTADFSWRDDFAAARNYAFSLATKEYCMWLDADDVLLPQDAAQLLALKQSPGPHPDVFMLPYHTAFDETGRPVFTYYRERLLRNHMGFLWEGAVHEAIAPRGWVEYLPIAVTHRKEKPAEPGRNLRILEKLIEQGQRLDPRLQFYYARELYDHGQYRKAQEEFCSFLHSGQGWVENNIEACRQLGACRLALGDTPGALGALFFSFTYDEPRAEVCCDVGNLFFEQAQYGRAAYWYRAALRAPRKDDTGAFVQEDCHGYLPCLQLCVCYYQLGDLRRSRRMNERAARYKDSEACRYNRRFFASLAQSTAAAAPQ